MKKWVLFDLDGTLTDPMIGITSAVKYALSKFGIDVPYLKDLIPFIGPPLIDSFMDFYGMTREEAVLAVKYYREYYAPKGLYENEVYPGIADLLSRLEESGLDLAVATTKPTDFAEEILRYFGLRDYFTLVVGSEFDGRRTDKAEVISYIIRRAQVASGEVIMVGDRRHDMVGGAACGVDTIGVLYGYGTREELEGAGAAYIVESVGDLEKQIYKIMEKEAREVRRFRSWNRNQPEIPQPVSFGGRVRFGVAGTGSDAEKFCYANRFGGQYELTAVLGENAEQALAFAARKGRVICFEDPCELAGWDGIDAVYISADVVDRCELAITMMKAGKHVLCAAPMARSGEDVKRMFETAEENGVILLEGIPVLYAPVFEKMKPYVASLGRIRHATFLSCHASVEYEHWKRGIVTEEFDPEKSSGALMELGACPLSLMIRLFGAPKSVEAKSVRLRNGMTITGTILLEYEEMIGEIICSKITESVMPSQLQGEEGSMLIEEIDNIKDLRIRRRKVEQSVHFEQSDNILNHETNAFIRMIHTGLGWEESRDVSLKAIELLEEVCGK